MFGGFLFFGLVFVDVASRSVKSISDMVVSRGRLQIWPQGKYDGKSVQFLDQINPGDSSGLRS